MAGALPESCVRTAQLSGVPSGNAHCNAEVSQQLQVQADDRQRYRQASHGSGADRQRAHLAPVGNDL